VQDDLQAPNMKHDSATGDRRALIKEKMQTYLDLARQGKNDWWRYVLAVFLMLFMWQIIGALPSAALIIWGVIRGGLPVRVQGGLPGTDMLTGFIGLMLASVFFMIGIYLAMHLIHRRRLLTLITPANSIDWERFFQGFGVWFLLSALMAVVEALLYPGRYVWSLDLQHLFLFVFLAVFFIPIQTSAEELFFRGYILQGFGLRLRNIWALSAISGLLFGLPHLLNPEATANYPLFGFYYFAFGFSLAFITLRDERLELALGAHAANNLFSVIFANYTVTVLPSPSLYTITVLDAFYSVPAALIGMAIFVTLFARLWREKPPAEESRMLS
jgi:membrane protease YdiL (CAAX protease family)